MRGERKSSFKSCSGVESVLSRTFNSAIAPTQGSSEEKTVLTKKRPLALVKKRGGLLSQQWGWGYLGEPHGHCLYFVEPIQSECSLLRLLLLQLKEKGLWRSVKGVLRSSFPAPMRCSTTQCRSSTET